MDIIRPNNPSFTRLTGREEVGLYPYRFGIGLNATYAQPALDSMFDTQGFLAPYGPTTLEQRDPYYNSTLPDPSYCKSTTYPAITLLFHHTSYESHDSTLR